MLPGVAVSFVMLFVLNSAASISCSLCVCTACRRFTPNLVEFYHALQMQSSEEFEVVYCSLDNMRVEYEAYSKKMPWWSLPFQSPVIQRLVSTYGAHGIPHLVVLDRDGTLLVHDAVERLSVPTGSSHENSNTCAAADSWQQHMQAMVKAFPWRPRRLVDILPEQFPFLQHNQQNFFVDPNKYLLLFSSASWCPPCQRFQEKLIELNHRLRAERNDFEVGYFCFLSIALKFQSCL